MSVKIYPYKQGSKSAHTLSRALRGRVLYLQGSRYRPRRRDTIINWGSSAQANYPNMINNPYNVRIAADKLESFVCLSNRGVQIPPFWTNRDDIPDEAFPVVCRTILNGHSGAGIVIADTRDDLVNAPLYVKYMKKRDEYRIHIGMHGMARAMSMYGVMSTRPSKSLSRVCWQCGPLALTSALLILFGTITMSWPLY